MLLCIMCAYCITDYLFLKGGVVMEVSKFFNMLLDPLYSLILPGTPTDNFVQFMFLSTFVAVFIGMIIKLFFDWR